MNISIIIPNYNGEELLKKNLPKVLSAARNYKNGSVEIIIPDDPSTDDSAKIIDNFIKNIKDKNVKGMTIKNSNKSHAGFSHNVNRGVIHSTGEIIILLNTDVAPREDFLDPLISHFEDESVFAVGCMDESVENGKTVLKGRGIGKFERGFLIHSKGGIHKVNTLWVSGGSGAFRRATWDKLGGLDTLYDPFYWEDIDISYRALKSGFKVFFEPRSVVRHEHEKGIVKRDYEESYVKRIAYRNQFIFVWKNITDRKMINSHFLHLPYHLLKSIKDLDFAFWSGFFMALSEIKKIENQRREIKKLFVRTDSSILRDYKD